MNLDWVFYPVLYRTRCLDNYAWSEKRIIKNESNTYIMVRNNSKYIQGYLLSMV